MQHAEDAYSQQIYEIQKEVGFQFEFSEISEEAIDMVLNRKWCGESFSDAIWKNTQKVADEVRDVLLIELMTGQRQEDAARALAERMAAGAMQSRRIIRTESNYISGQVQLQAYEECGAEKYLYVATLDSRTDEECGMLDGKTFFVKDAQPGVNFHPMHPNCRCTDIIALDDDTLKNLQRRARDPETGENELVPAGTTWEEWRKQNYLNEPKKVRDIASNFYKKGIAKNKDDAMNMARLFDKYHKSNDPGLLIDGPISESHPEEMERILKEAEEKGVEIRFSRGSTAYAPGIRPGEPGQLHLMPTDSYSAWLHEEQHMLDEEKDGWPGYRALEDIDRRTRMEYNAYRREIEYAESCGRPDVADMHKEAFRKEVISFGGEPIEI